MSNIVSAFALFVALISLIYSIRQRRNLMREYLYKRQFDIFEKLGGYVYEISNDFTYRLIFNENKKSNNIKTDIARLVNNEIEDKQIIKAAEEIEDILKHSKLYISEEIFDSATDLISEINKNLNFLSSEKAVDRITYKVENLYYLLRSELGVETLHKENKNVIKRLIPF
jgi:hypothetical protein